MKGPYACGKQGLANTCILYLAFMSGLHLQLACNAYTCWNIAQGHEGLQQHCSNAHMCDCWLSPIQMLRLEHICKVAEHPRVQHVMHAGQDRSAGHNLYQM